MPGSLSATEWVGVAVLLLGSGSVWSIIRGSKPIEPFVSARTVGIAAFGTILAGIWIGVAVHIIGGALILATGCGLSIWSVLLSFGVSWRRHIRPSIIPSILGIIFGTCGAFWPRPTIAIALLMAWWVRRTQRKMREAIDWQLTQVITRMLVLSHVDTATYIIETWFERFRKTASDLGVLTLAARARTRALLLPRSRAVLTAAEALDVLAIVAGSTLDRRLRTDDAALRPSSWVRILAKELFRQFLRRSGFVALVRLATGLLLAVPPAAKEPPTREPVVELAPDAEGYVVERVADLPPITTLTDARELRRRVIRDASVGGLDWLASISAHAERWREEAHNGEQRLELVTEVIWSVYEDVIGSRPLKYDLFYQLWLQAPELVDKLSIREVHIEDDIMSLGLNGVPSSFHGSVSAVVIEDRHRTRWAFRKLETSGQGVDLHFMREGARRHHAIREAPAPVKARKKLASPNLSREVDSLR